MKLLKKKKTLTRSLSLTYDNLPSRAPLLPYDENTRHNYVVTIGPSAMPQYVYILCSTRQLHLSGVILTLVNDKYTRHWQNFYLQ